MGQTQTKADGPQTSRGQSERQPFDTRELANFPFPDERDPPYRPWWVDFNLDQDRDSGEPH